MTKGKYLDPKADLTFKKVFGEHPELVKSLLNALLLLDEGQQIEDVEYMEPEMVPENPAKKNSIFVDEAEVRYAIGREEGEANVNRNNARKMKADNMSPAHIAKYTGLSVKEIEQL